MHAQLVRGDRWSDFLGTWGKPTTTGKPIGNDLWQKKTLPVDFRLCGEGPYREEHWRILTLQSVSDADVAHATELLERSGARQWVSDIVEREMALALRTLEGLPIAGDVRGELEEVAQFVATREA